MTTFLTRLLPLTEYYSWERAPWHAVLQLQYGLHCKVTDARSIRKPDRKGLDQFPRSSITSSGPRHRP